MLREHTHRHTHLAPPLLLSNLASQIRLQADATLPVEFRRNYKGAVDALMRIAKEEGILGWWRVGCAVVSLVVSLSLGISFSFSSLGLRPYSQSSDGSQYGNAGVI